MLNLDRFRALAAATVMLALVASGCQTPTEVTPTEVTVSTPDSTPTSLVEGSPTTAPPPTAPPPTDTTAMITVTSESTSDYLPHLKTVYLLEQADEEGESPRWRLAPIAHNTDTLEETLRVLVSGGLSPTETEIGLFTAFRPTNSLLSVDRAGTAVTVDVSDPIGALTDSKVIRAAQAQLVFTVTAFDSSVEAVHLLVDGEPLVEGNPPLRRDSFNDLGRVVVEYPHRDSTVQPPFAVSGTALESDTVEIYVQNGSGLTYGAFPKTIPVDVTGEFSIVISREELPDRPLWLWLRVVTTSSDGAFVDEQVFELYYTRFPYP